MGKIDYNEVKKQADRFYESYHILYPIADNEGSLHLMPPMVVCAAFSCELYLKARYIMESEKDIRKKHSLRVLFGWLGGESREVVIEKLRHNTALTVHIMKKGIKKHFEHAPSDHTTIAALIDDELEKCSFAFENWRYVYESTTIYNPYPFIDCFLEALHDAWKEGWAPPALR